MNLDIFDDENYYNKINEILFIYETNPVFPFNQMRLNPDNLVSDLYDATDIYNFLQKVHFIYHCDQVYIGHVKLDDNDYIIQVDDELNIYIIGDNEVNWTNFLLDDNDYLEFKQFYRLNYKKEFKEPDYDLFFTIQNKYITF